jgi:hypothetical protein
VQAGGVVLLDYEAAAGFLCEFSGRLGCFVEAALAFVFFQGHGEHYLTTKGTKVHEGNLNCTRLRCSFCLGGWGTWNFDAIESLRDLRTL